MKVLVTSLNLKRPGGVGNFTELLIKNLRSLDFSVTHFTQGKSLVPWRNIFLPLIILLQLFKFKKILKNSKPDIIIINPSLLWYSIIRDFVFMGIAKKIGIPVVFFIHGWDKNVEARFAHGSFLRNFFRTRFNYADRIIVLATQFQTKLVELGVHESKILISKPMVETESYTVSNRHFKQPYTILFCGNAVRTKGIFLLLESVPLVLSAYPQTKFIFVGGGDDLPNLKKMVNDMGLSRSVKLTGQISLPRKIAIFRKSDIFTFPTYFVEGFPAVIVEAMAAGLPLVTTPKAALKENLKNGLNGYLIDELPPSPNEISKCILRIIENPDKSHSMSKYNVKEALTTYDAKVVSAEVASICKSIF